MRFREGKCSAGPWPSTCPSSSSNSAATPIHSCGLGRQRLRPGHARSRRHGQRGVEVLERRLISRLHLRPGFLSVNGDQLEAIILFIDSNDETTSRLLMFQDTGVTGLPLTPDGNNVQIVVSSSGWFTL
jgi:hypothetical protein